MKKKMLVIMTGILVTLLPLAATGEQLGGQILSFDIESLCPIFFVENAKPGHVAKVHSPPNVKRQDLTPRRARLLLVDETKTFASTMRVGALAGILRKTGMVDLSIELVDVESSYGDPLAGLAPTEEPYDIILIIPKGIDDGSVKQIWLVTRFFEESSPEEVGLAALSGIIDQIFQGLATAIDVSEDLWPGGYAALYLQQGWLR